MAAEYLEPQSYAVGVTVEDVWCGQLFSGRWSDLLAAGLVREEWMPSLPGRRVSLRLTDDGKYVRQRQQSKHTSVTVFKQSKYKFVVRRIWSQEERERYEHERKLRDAKKRAQDEIDSLPQDVEEARSGMIRGANTFMNILEEMCTKESFRLRDSERFRQVLGVLRSIVMSDGLVFDRQGRRRDVERICERHGVEPPQSAPVLTLVHSKDEAA